MSARDKSETPYDVDSPCWSWRGTPGIEQQEYGRYFAKGMRIDHVLVSNDLMERIAAVEILGHSRHRIGFFGSDHAPVLVTLKSGEQNCEPSRKKQHIESLSVDLDPDPDAASASPQCSAEATR